MGSWKRLKVLKHLRMVEKGFYLLPGCPRSALLRSAEIVEAASDLL